MRVAILLGCLLLTGCEAGGRKAAQLLETPTTASSAAPAPAAETDVEIGEIRAVCRSSLVAAMNGDPAALERTVSAMPEPKATTIGTLCSLYLEGAADYRELAVQRETQRRTI